MSGPGEEQGMGMGRSEGEGEGTGAGAGAAGPQADALETLLNHPPEVVIPGDNRPLVAPIHQSVKFEFEAVDEALRLFRGERAGFFYQRSGNPTTRQLELTLAQLQGREDCIACASGVAAINGALMGLTAAGDHVLCFMESYGPTRIFIRRTLARFGVRHTLLSIEDLAAVERVLASTPTKLMVFESPTNPVNKVADIEALCALARRHGVLTLLDNTFAGPHQHGQFRVDLFLHSLTKFAAGHGDVMGGAVIGEVALLRGLRHEFTNLGGVLDPHAAFLIQRGLRSYFVRYRAAGASALRVAQFLAAHAGVVAVHYPGLASDRWHALAARQMADFGSVLSFEIAGGAEAARACVESLRLFATAASLGSTESLALPSQMLTARDLDAAQQQQSGLRPGLVRLSIGLEAVDDLIGDLGQALERASAPG
jgi:cystathionine beta-lyase/cystathionine gamma-synthase